MPGGARAPPGMNFSVEEWNLSIPKRSDKKSILMVPPKEINPKGDYKLFGFLVFSFRNVILHTSEELCHASGR
jgi:hypothetical protein